MKTPFVNGLRGALCKLSGPIVEKRRELPTLDYFIGFSSNREIRSRVLVYCTHIVGTSYFSIVWGRFCSNARGGRAQESIFVGYRILTAFLIVL